MSGELRPGDLTTDDLQQVKRNLSEIERQYLPRASRLSRTDQNVVALAMICRTLIDRVQDLEAILKEMSE